MALMALLALLALRVFGSLIGIFARVHIIPSISSLFQLCRTLSSHANEKQRVIGANREQRD